MRFTRNSGPTMRCVVTMLARPMNATNMSRPPTSARSVTFCCVTSSCRWFCTDCRSASYLRSISARLSVPFFSPCPLLPVEVGRDVADQLRNQYLQLGLGLPARRLHVPRALQRFRGPGHHQHLDLEPRRAVRLQRRLEQVAL